MSVAEFADREGLTRVGGRPPLGEYLAEVWQRRQFILTLARFRITAENQENRLGMLWIIIKPLLNAAVYGLVFGLILGSANRPEHFVQFLVVGVFLFEFFSASFNSGAKSITSNQALVQSLSFPRMVLPLATIVQRYLQFLPMLLVAMPIVMAAGYMPRWEWLLLFPLTVIFFVFNTGLALITARLTVHFRDLNQLLPFITRLAFYTSGIFFSIEKQLADNEIALRIAGAMPLHEILTLGRGILMGGPDNPERPEFWLYTSIWAVAMLAIGVVFFWRAEERYGRPD